MPARERDGVGQVAEPKSVGDRNRRGEDLHQELRPRGKARAVIDDAQSENQYGAQSQTLEVLGGGEVLDQQREGDPETRPEAEGDRQPPQEGHARPNAHTAIVGPVDDLELAGQPRHERRRNAGHGEGHSQRYQRVQPLHRWVVSLPFLWGSRPGCDHDAPLGTAWVSRGGSRSCIRTVLD